MQRSEFPPHRSACEGYLTVKNVSGASISSSKGPQGALSLSLSPLFSLSLSNGARPFRFTGEYPFRIGTKNTTIVVDTLVQLRGTSGYSGPSKYHRGVEVRRRIKNSTGGFVTAVARDTRFCIARVRLYDRTRAFALQPLADCENEKDRENANEIFLRLS